MLRAQTACGDTNAATTSGLVAYVHDDPAGWVAVEPRTAYPKLRTSRVAWSGRDEDRGDDGIWAVTCFVVRKGYRGRPHLSRSPGQRSTSPESAAPGRPRLTHRRPLHLVGRSR